MVDGGFVHKITVLKCSNVTSEKDLKYIMSPTKHKTNVNKDALSRISPRVRLMVSVSIEC